MIYSGFSLIWSPSPEIAMIKFFDLLLVPVVLISYPQISIIKREDINNILRLLYYIAIISSLIIIYSNTLLEDPLAIFNSTHINVGRSVGIGLPIGVYYYLHRENKSRISVLTGLFIILASLVMIESRGPTLAAISSAILIGIYYMLNQIGLYKSVLSVLSSILLLMMSWLSGVSTSLFSNIDIGDFSLLVSGELDPSAQLRIEYYYNAVEMWVSSPLIGSGLSGYFTQYDIFPHNIVLEIGAELGLIGVSLFGLFVISGYRSIRSQNESTLGIMLLAIVVFALVNASVSSSLPGQRLLFFALGLAVSPTLFR
jgi:hypothetical protein